MRYTVVVMSLCLAGSAWAQESSPPAQTDPWKNQAPPRSQTAERDKEAGESSSRANHVDLSPPKGDDKAHPESGAAVSDALSGSSDTNPTASEDVQEFHPWDPLKAAKDLEVGDFYFRRKNYRAALDRYQEALLWKKNDAVANFRAAQCLEKLKQADDAVAHYVEYLKILPHGQFSNDARKALEKLGAADAIPATESAPSPAAKAEAPTQ